MVNVRVVQCSNDAGVECAPPEVLEKLKDLELSLHWFFPHKSYQQSEYDEKMMADTIKWTQSVVNS